MNNPEDIIDYAERNFSNFSGYSSDYTGAGDEFIDFGGSPTQSFAILDERSFKLTITAGTQGGEVYLFPGLMWHPGQTSNGYVKTGDFKDTSGAATLKAMGSPQPIETLFSYLTYMPTSLIQVKISSNIGNSLEQMLILENMYPFGAKGERIIDPSVYINENTYKDRLVTVPISGVTLGPDVRIRTNIIANSSTTYAFNFGNSINIRQALSKKQGIAAANLMRAGFVPTTTTQRFAAAAPERRSIGTSSRMISAR